MIRGNEFNMGCECVWADRILSLPCLYRRDTSFPCTSALFSIASHLILGRISQVSAREAEAEYAYKSYTHTRTHTSKHWLSLHNCRSWLSMSEIFKAVSQEGKNEVGWNTWAGVKSSCTQEEFHLFLRAASGPRVEPFNRFSQD